LHFPTQLPTHWQVPVPVAQARPFAVQSTQAIPPLPQALLDVPGRHALALSQQPPHVLAGHGLPQPSSAPAHLLAQLGTQAHAPETQVRPEDVQSVQASPPVPHALLPVPDLHLPSAPQHPLQVLAGQGAPQPSSSP
jgi:hypothetical protein